MENPLIAFYQQRIGQKITKNASPLAIWLGGEILEVEEGKLSMAFTVRNEMINVAGTLHGGIIATMLDEVIGAMIYLLNEEYFRTTVNLSLDYLSAAKEGDRVIATANIVRKGRQIANTEATLTTTEGKILAKATSNLLTTPIKIR